MITYPRNIESKYVLYRLSTSEVVKRNAQYPRLDGMELVGADPDYVYLEMVEGVRPDYDSRLFELVLTETPILDDGIWEMVWTTQKRPVDVIVQQVENVETNANEQLLPYNQQMKILLLGIGVALRQIEAQTLTAKERAIRDKVIQLAVKVWKNDDTRQQLIDLVTQGQEPDLDAGWENA